MIVYGHRDKVKGGMPIGGIGAGKFEVLPNGAFDAFTFLNNWPQPVAGSGAYRGILGYHLGVFVEDASGKRYFKKAALLQTQSVDALPTVAGIRYESEYPRTTLIYDTAELGLQVSLDVFSSWAPGSAYESSLPAAFFTWRVKNLKKTAVKAAFIFIGRNLCGEWCVGRKNKVFEDARMLHLEFSNPDPAGFDPREGEMCFSFQKKGWRLSFMESWNAVTKNFVFTPDTVRLLAWEEFARRGELPDSRSRALPSGENRELCGAVAATRALGAGRSAELRFTAGWFFPEKRFGHRYETAFKSAAAVSLHALSRHETVDKKIRVFHELVHELPFPEWFRDALLATLAPFFASSWYVKDGRFSFYEAPEICPLMGTVDVGFYGSIPLSYFFPELEYSLLSQFAKAQRPDGYIPHDLGRNRLDTPSDGTTFHFWKDLNPKFALMAWRDYVWSGKKENLKKLYPHVKKAMDWTAGIDRDRDGLPDHEGADQTFDLWDFQGANAYTSGIYLAALLAGQRMAKLFHDARFYESCQRRYSLARRSFEQKLWNGRSFSPVSALAQLNGQWYASLLGLGFIADERKIRTALETIFRRGLNTSRFGFVNGVLADGRPDPSNNHSKNLWVGMNWAFVSLCISNGLSTNQLLKRVYKVWDNIANIQKSPWNQPDMIDAKTGRYLFGDFYYRNMAIWAVPIAHAMKNRKTAALLQKIKSLGTE